MIQNYSFILSAPVIDNVFGAEVLLLLEKVLRTIQKLNTNLFEPFSTLFTSSVPSSLLPPVSKPLVPMSEESKLDEGLAKMKVQFQNEKQKYEDLQTGE